MTEPTNGPDSFGPVERRTVLQMTGSVAIASGAMAGTASAHVIDEAVFCGCSQVCACGNGAVEVIVARETDDGYTCERIPIDEDEETDFSFCYEVEDGKVIAIEEGDGVTVCNPHEPCAGDAIDDCSTDFNCQSNANRYGQSGGPCGDAFLRSCGDGDDGGRGQGRGRSNGRGGSERGNGRGH